MALCRNCVPLSCSRNILRCRSGSKLSETAVVVIVAAVPRGGSAGTESLM